MKLKLGLVPGFFIKALAVPFMLGEAKYQRGDWAHHDVKTFVPARLDSAMRHLADVLDGQMFDEDGQNNLAAAAWNCLVVLFYLNRDGGIALYNPDVYEARLKALAGDDAGANC